MFVSLVFVCCVCTELCDDLIARQLGLTPFVHLTACDLQASKQANYV